MNLNYLIEFKKENAFKIKNFLELNPESILKPSINDDSEILIINQNEISTDSIQTYCEFNKLDYVDSFFIKKNQLKLCAMDMDSTLINIECIDEMAKFLGRGEEVARITEDAMLGNIDFNDSLKKRVEYLKGFNVDDCQKIIKKMNLHHGVKEWIIYCRKNDIKTAVISGGFSFFTDYLKNELGLDYTFSNQLEVKNKKLTGDLQGKIINASEKENIIKSIQNDLGISKAETVTIVDGSNDLLMTKQSALSIGYKAKNTITRELTWNIKYGDYFSIMNFLTN
jgi:phosphoserine phosphatase